MITRLANGLTVVSDTMAHVDSVALGVWVRAGSRSENPDEHGLAHFLEHMAFKGTANRSARDISIAIEAVGGDINANTSVETTAYHTHMLSEDMPLALNILADILTAPSFDPAEVTRERGVICQEISAAEDVPEDRAFDAFPETAFGGQAIGRRILGTRESVAAVTSDTLRAFMGKHYGASAMTLVAAGKVDHEALASAAERAFADVPAEAPSEPSAGRYTGGTHVEEIASAHESQWLLGFEGRAATDDASVAAHLAAMVMGGGLSSRLFQALREERGLVYDTSAFHWAFADTGLFGVHLGTSPDQLAEAATIVLDELEDALETIGEDELDRAKALQRAGLLMSRESAVSRMGQAARQVFVFGRTISKEERIAEIERVGLAEVRTVLAEILASAPTLTAVGSHAGPSAEDVAARFGSSPRLRGAA